MSTEKPKSVFTRRWKPVRGAHDTPKPCGVYLLHGTGEHSGRYEQFANALARSGWAVGAHDHPGHGQSGGKRGSVFPAGLLATQAAMQVQAFANETGAAPILFGHSLGGVVASELVLTHHLPVSGLMLSAPAFKPYLSTINRLKVEALHAVAPDKVVELSYRPELLTRDESIQQQGRQDKLIHGFRSARMIRYMLDSGAESIAQVHRLNTPTLVLIAGADPVVDNQAINKWVKRAPKDSVTAKTYEGAYHEILNELPETRSLVTADVLEWLNNLSLG